MLRRYGVSVLAAVVALAITISPREAVADDNDFVLARLGTVVNDGTGMPYDVVGNNLLFRSFVSELGTVLAPRLLSPSDTLGFGGFQFTTDFGFTGIDNEAEYWSVLESSTQPGTAGVSHGTASMKTVGIFARKGLWLPVPSIEVGLGAVHLINSRIWTAQGYVKFALHEGYHDLPLPSVAVRGSASRMMGAKDLDLTVAGFDVSVSKSIGIAGTWNLAPYGGWNMLIIVPRSEVIDKTPHIAGDTNMNFVFKDQDDIVRHKLFLGAKLKYYVFTMALEAGFTLSGSSVDDRSGTSMSCADATTVGDQDSCDATDTAGVQGTYTFSIGLDF
jgi:hypothetical protein